MKTAEGPQYHNQALIEQRCKFYLIGVETGTIYQTYPRMLQKKSIAILEQQMIFIL